MLARETYLKQEFHYLAFKATLYLQTSIKWPGRAQHFLSYRAIKFKKFKHIFLTIISVFTKKYL